MKKILQQVNSSPPPPGRWVWNDEAQSLEFSSPNPAVEGLLKKRRDTHVKDLHQRPERLDQLSAVNTRGRQSIRKTLRPSHLSAYRASVMQRAHVTMEDVKQVAVSLLQENYSLPVPFCFLAVLKMKELDEFLSVLLLYLSCYLERKSLENKAESLMAEQSITARQVMAQTVAKVDVAQKKLAVCYFSLIMGPGMGQHHRMGCRKSPVLSPYRDRLLHECLYSFSCYAAWVALGRKDLRGIQEEVGRLLHSDLFNAAPRNRTDGNQGETPRDRDGSVETERDHPRGQQGRSGPERRTSQKRPALSSIVTQRSPLMASLLPSPKEQAPHLFLGSRARRQNLLQAERCDTEALTEELNQQLASVSFGILGKPLRQFSSTTLMPKGAKETGEDEDEEDDEDDEIHDNEDSDDQPGVRVRDSKSSFMLTPRSSAYRTTAGISRTSTEASDTE